ncbi:hypothetical protein Tco_1205732 [Tanacetum coccineum]
MKSPIFVQQRFDESFSEAWDQFKDLLRACPHHGFSELHKLDTFYNALNSNDQDSLNSPMRRDCLAIIESKSKVRYSQSKAIVFAKVSTSSSTLGVSPDVSKLKDMVKALLLDKKNQSQAPATVKAVEESYEVDINKKTENRAKMTKLSMEWKRLCKIKAKVQKCQSQSQYRRISSQTGAGTEEYY